MSVSQQSLATTKGQAASAARTRSARGRVAAGLVAAIQSAFTCPSSTASNISTALRPGFAARFGACQKRRSASTSPGSSQRMWAASWLARPPTSRPPMAFGWPVTLNGPMPGRPMRPVARWQLMMAFTLSVPAEDWLTPWEKTVSTRSVRANRV